MANVVDRRLVAMARALREHVGVSLFASVADQYDARPALVPAQRG